MLDFLFHYGLFVAKTVTICILIVLTFGFIFSIIARAKRSEGSFNILNINEKLEDIQESFERETLPKKKFKDFIKQRKKALKQQKTDENKKRLFVIKFDGDIRATQVAELREIITAVLATANSNDEVLVILESAGGFVHQYGLAASQLKRIRDRGILLTVAIDKLAASGGYLMACVANKIIAAPFAIVGSIGVVGQMPNFHKLLEKNHIEFEQHTAGEHKRTITMFGKNTEKDRKKFREELDLTHQLFKDFIDEHRPIVDLAKVATGEHWHASYAMQFNLVDAVMTSDDYILSNHPAKAIFEISYITKHTLKDK
ncbi:MAG TPA: protease SohB, partial [Gammaproteobacteria bacterium]|nr:protease SohB [Gammaproteobacteria bacterium]